MKEIYIEEMHMYRVTITPLIINKARTILLLVTGKEKSRILSNVLNCPGQPDKYPAQLIHPASHIPRKYLYKNEHSHQKRMIFVLTNRINVKL